MKIKVILIGLLISLTAIFSLGCSYSAYDIAVKNGFVGTEEEWLRSLSGTDGTDGADLSIDDIYIKAKEEGFEGNYLDFLNEYLTFNESIDNAEAITKAMRSAILVYCKFERRSTIYQSGGQFAQAGAGVIYNINKERGSVYIVTNYHVVYSSDGSTTNNISDSITVTPYGGSPIDAEFVGGSAQYDIAILRAANPYFKTDLPIAVSVDKSDISVGETVIAIGNPAGQGISATQGIVSVESETITLESIDGSSSYISSRVMRIDAAVNSGNSGGGLFNARGELVGIVNAKSDDTSIENIGYAIPAAVATAVADNIIKNTVFTKGVAGITIGSRDSSAYIGEDGLIKISETVYVGSVSGAAKGILMAEDVILSITLNGTEVKVTRSFHVTDTMLSSAPGDVVTFKVLRGDSELSLDVTLGA